MPKEILFRMSGHNLEVGWSKGGEATAKAIPNANPLMNSNTFGLSELDHAILVLQKIRKQVFETSLVEALLDSKFLTQLAKNTPSVRAGGSVTQPNVPNSEALIAFRESDEPTRLPLEGISKFVKWDSTTLPTATWGENPQHSAGLLYLREKMFVEPTTAWAGRAVQRTGDGRLENADMYRELFVKNFLTLNSRFDNFLEIVLRQAVFGGLDLKYDYVVASIDYMFPEDRFVMGNDFETGIPWALERYQTVHEKEPTHAYLSAELFAEIDNPEQYDVVWCPAPVIVGDDGKTAQPHANKIAFVNWEGQPLRVVEGPSADWDAPKDHTGKFGKGWRASDPSTTQILLEWSFIPVWDSTPVVVLDLG